MRYTPFARAALLAVVLAGCKSTSEPEPRPGILLQDDFNAENGAAYKLNYTGFTHWTVTRGSVDLVGTSPYDDFLPTTQGMYVDLDGTTKAAGRLQSQREFTLYPGTYRLEFRLAGMPRNNQPPNRVQVSLGSAHAETIEMASYAPLQAFTRTIEVGARTTARLVFDHEGGDDFGIFLDDVKLSRL